MARKKAKKKVIAHPRIRKTCSICGRRHSPSVHSFHGIGSYGTSRSEANIARALLKAGFGKKKKKRKTKRKK